jgi:glycosyltransferase involved in cell wall biosynthesis
VSIVDPFWEKRGTPAQDARRLLLISYHFPPDTTIGARRWEKLAHAVTERGWGLDVITCRPSAIDAKRLDSLPGGVRVYGVADPELTSERVEHVLWRMYRMVWPNRRLAAPASHAEGAAATRAARERPESLERSEIRASPRTPRELLRTYWAWLELTHGMRWAHRASELAVHIIVKGVHEAVITSAPPHMSHEAGRLVSRASGLPFVMDMRDPWSLQPWLRESVASPLWYRRAEACERACIEQAKLIVANTEPAHGALASEYPDARDRIITVMNGSDDDPLPPHRHRDRFTIGYAGTIYLDRDPLLLFRAAAQVIRTESLTPRQFGIDILGRFAAEEHVPLLGMATREGIADYVTVEPPRPQQAALEFLAGASMLVIFPGSNTLAIPAKVFEYIRFDSWLLTIAEPASGIAQLLRGSTADVVEPQVNAVAAAITARYRDHVAGVRPTRVAVDDRFSRTAQARLLLDAIAKVVAPTAR